MIIVEISGGLANQMFEYAFALSASRRLRTPFYMASLRGRDFKLTQYFELKYYKFYRSRIAYFGFKILEKFKIAKPNMLSGIPMDDIQNLKDWSYNIGYAQSDQYFDTIKEEVESEFIIKKKYQKKFRDKYGHLFEKHKTIVIHLRRKDYAAFGNKDLGGKGLILPNSYFIKCLALIKNIGDYQVIFVSDDIELVKKEFGGRSNFHFEHNDMIIDFQLIQNADIAIISNSSFSWWASYLSPKLNRITYAPKYWLGFKVNREYPMQIMTSKFKWISVND